MALDHLVVDGPGHVIDVEGAGLARHLGMEDDLEQQIAQLGAKRVHIAMLDRIGDLIGFLDGIGRDGWRSFVPCPRDNPEPDRGSRAMMAIRRSWAAMSGSRGSAGDDFKGVIFGIRMRTSTAWGRLIRDPVDVCRIIHISHNVYYDKYNHNQ